MKTFFFLIALMLLGFQSCTQPIDSVNIKSLNAKGDGKTDDTKTFKEASKYKKIKIPKGNYVVDRTQLPFSNFILDSGVTITSTTYAPYLSGKIDLKNSYQQKYFAYQCYNPFVEVSTVIEAKRNFFQYNHMPSITFFDGYFYLFWTGLASGGEEISEGTPGQKNFMTKSTDAKHWSSPIAIFNDPAYTNNPIPANHAKYRQWQPNVIALADRLLIIWSETGRENASYISILIRGQKKITTYRIDINKLDKTIKLNDDLSSSPPSGFSKDYTYNTKEYFIFSTQNPYQTSSGRILIPFSVEESSGDVYSRVKWASFIYTDNPADLKSYAFGDLTQGTTPTSAWEPFFTEDRNGTIYMLMRSLPSSDKKEDKKNDHLEIAKSSNGLSFSNVELSDIVGPSSRAYAERISNNRFMMVYNDADKNYRINAVANFSRYGGYDFTPGVSLQKDVDKPGDLASNYPQSIVYRDTAYVVYSTVFEPRKIMLAKFRLGIPDDTLLVLPRNRPRKYLSGYIDDSHKAIGLTGSKTFRLTKPLIVSDNNVVNSDGSFTISVWLKKQYDEFSGTIFDNRGALKKADYSGKGLAIGTSNIVLGTVSNGINLSANLSYDFKTSGYTGLVAQLFTKDSYLGVTVNTHTKSMAIYMDDGNYSASNSNGGFYKCDYYWQAIEISDNFKNGQTITVDQKTFTFRNSPSDSSDIKIGPSLAVSCANLKSKLKDLLLVGWSKNGVNITKSQTLLIAFFKKNKPLADIKSTNKSVFLYNKNIVDGPTPSIGSSIRNSGLPGFSGYIYLMQLYKGDQGAKSEGFHRYLFNKLASQFGYDYKKDVESNDDHPYISIDYKHTGLLQNVMKTKSRQEYSYKNQLLTLYSNSSAGVETEGSDYEITVPFMINNPNNASPVICTFQDSKISYKIQSDSVGNISCNGKFIRKISLKDKNVLILKYQNNNMLIDGHSGFPLKQRPIIMLGVYDFFAPMNGDYSITYDLSNIHLKVLD